MGISLLVPELGSLEGKIFFGILGFSWTSFAWEQYLAYRQNKVYKKNVQPPKELEDVTDTVTYEKARLYGIDKSCFGIINNIFSQFLNTGVMLCGGIPLLWKFAETLILQTGYEGQSEIAQTMMFINVASLITFFLDIPWSFYFTFKIEQKHGFNKQTIGFFVKDKLKKMVISQLLVSPFIAGLVYIVQVGGDYFFIYLWGFATAVMLFLMTVYPDYIAPLFDKYEPLEDGHLKEEIHKLAKSLEFPLTKLYVVEGSKRSAHSNAYFYGFFKNKRIVLYDTLIEGYVSSKENEKKDESAGEKLIEKSKGCNTQEIVAVLGHELGHWKLNHILKGIVISQVNMFMMFFAFGMLYKYNPLYSAFGFHKSRPIFIGFIIILQYVFAPYSELLNFLMTVFTRYNEFQADDFACQLGSGKDLKTSLIKLNNDNLSFPVYDYYYSTWHHSHPPLIERIKAIDLYMKKSK